MSDAGSPHRDPGGPESSRSTASTDKPHPSEFLEFVTVAGGPTQHRLEPLRTQTAKESTEDRVNVTRSNDDLFHGLSAAIPSLRRLSVDARAATKAEHAMTFLTGCRLYPKAIAWSLLLSMTIVMEGYDLTLVNSFFAFPVFRRSYGKPLHPDAPPGQQDYQISPAWQSGLTNAAVVGEIIGLFFNGVLTDRFGYHKTMVGTLVWMALFVFLAFFAINIRMLLAAQILCGLPWGIFQTLSTTYAAEVMPVALRAYLTSNVNMCWLLGQICGVSVIRGLVHNNSEWSYRIPFGLQWAFAVPILVGVFFAPESPWWLVRHEKINEAKRSLLRLTTQDSDPDFNADETVAMMQHTNEVEKYLNGGGVSYFDCFKGTDLRRTEICCMVWCTQALCGSTMTGYAAYFYEQAGFNTADSFNLAIGMYGGAICAGILAWFGMRHIGRRTLYIAGLVLSLIILVVTGIVGTFKQSDGVSWALGSLIIVLTFVYDFTVGPVCYVLVAEIPSSRLRVKTVVIARVAYNVISIITNIITPRMLNPSAWDWKGKSCFFFAGTTLVCLVWCWFRLPEPMGLTYMELDILFEKKAKARKFREFQVNLASTGYFSLSTPNRTDSVWRGYQ
ncbi:Alpha-glucosides permease MPH2 [Cladophialophora carrionii]|uniref:Alpha-glucosides permease MPH2 n=1 Tax=Cladophialophora carrionii TaxID=86049 RepID=A0A1C1CRE5_9EURO|nr:Alpha-glucosides permease MPH2 [Cladophialophora carrionii]